MTVNQTSPTIIISQDGITGNRATQAIDAGADAVAAAAIAQAAADVVTAINQTDYGSIAAAVTLTADFGSIAA